MASITVLSEHACFGGTQGFYQHESAVIGLPMKFGVYRPPQAAAGRVPVLFYLAGLTCTEETFAIKAGAQRHAASHGLMLVTPDTSPRRTGVPGADADWEFGDGAGFYLDALRAPWRQHWQMETYVAGELPALIFAEFAADPGRAGIFGHSMGGHGALTLGLRHPQLFRSISAFAPIATPSQSLWGCKAFDGYLGSDRSTWHQHDATALIAAGARAPEILVDQGLADKFLPRHLGIDSFAAACRASGQPLTLRQHGGYDHGYYFIATLVAEHIAHHAAALK